MPRSDSDATAREPLPPDLSDPDAAAPASDPPASSLPERAWAEVPAVRAYLSRLLGGGADVDDLVQEVLARTCRYRDSFRPDGPLRGWLLRVAWRVFLDHRQRSQRHPSPLGDATETVPDPRTSGLEERDATEHHLAVLAPREREVLLRFHRDRQSIAEIAAALGIPEGTVKSHLHRARRRVACGGQR